METVKNPTTLKLLEAFNQIKKVNWHQSPIPGITFGELKVMFCVKKAAKPDKAGLKISEISNILNVAPPTVTQLINSLEAHGLVKRNLDKADRRAIRITITESGEKVIERANETFLTSFDGLVQFLGEEKSNELAEILSKAYIYFNQKRETNF